MTFNKSKGMKTIWNDVIWFSHCPFNCDIYINLETNEYKIIELDNKMVKDNTSTHTQTASQPAVIKRAMVRYACESIKKSRGKFIS